MTPERLMEIRTLVTSHNGTPKMSRELLAYVDELKARLALERANAAEMEERALVRAETAEQDAFALNAALTSAEVLLEQAYYLLGTVMDCLPKTTTWGLEIEGFLAKLKKRGTK